MNTPNQQWEYKVEYVFLDDRAMFPNFPEDPIECVETTDAFGEQILKESHDAKLEYLLNQYGAAGWEVVSISEDLLNSNSEDGSLLLKRPKRS